MTSQVGAGWQYSVRLVCQSCSGTKPDISVDSSSTGVDLRGFLSSFKACLVSSAWVWHRMQKLAHSEQGLDVHSTLQRGFASEALVTC